MPSHKTWMLLAPIIITSKTTTRRRVGGRKRVGPNKNPGQLVCELTGRVRAYRIRGGGEAAALEFKPSARWVSIEPQGFAPKIIGTCCLFGLPSSGLSGGRKVAVSLRSAWARAVTREG